MNATTDAVSISEAAEIAATIVVPTTGDRGPLLPCSVDSILRQSVQNIEIFIIGDGIDADTRSTIRQLAAQDARIKLFDHPKHESRGEPYRHEALKHARGKIVCYLCDRDLMLRNHVEVMLQALEQADICSTLQIALLRDGGFKIWHKEILEAGSDLKDPRFGLSMAAHTLEAYRNLPHGWRTSPPDEFTDVYMWKQFLDHGARARLLQLPTIIYLPRGGNHPGMPTHERLAELRALHATYVATGDNYAYIGRMLSHLFKASQPAEELRAQLNALQDKFTLGQTKLDTHKRAESPWQKMTNFIRGRR